MSYEKVGVNTYDASSKETFQLRAAVMWTINDFPAYGYLSGWCTYGHYARPCCNVDTCSKRLTHGKKFYYMDHCHCLDMSHKFQYDKKSFDGDKKLRVAPLTPSGSEVLNQLKDIKFTLGKHSKEVSGVIRKI